MASNSFGHNFVITTFGESHGPALGVIVDGCPSGIRFQKDLLDKNMQRRRPGGALVSPRKEDDQVEILSGVFEEHTIGTPIAMIVRNQNTRSQDYQQIKQEPRPGHADDVWKHKFIHVDHRGGGRSSGRETVARVMAGSIAEMFLKQKYSNLNVSALASRVGPYSLTSEELHKAARLSKDQIDQYPSRFPSAQSKELEKFLIDAKSQGKSYGGTVDVWATSVPEGWGEPVFHKLKSDLALALMSIGASCSLTLGDSTRAFDQEGSIFHNPQIKDDDYFDRYGGIRGGISTGKHIHLQVGFKSPASVLEVAQAGRHDPCIIARVIPVVEAMVYLVLADHALWHRQNRLNY